MFESRRKMAVEVIGTWRSSRWVKALILKNEQIQGVNTVLIVRSESV